MFITKHTKMTHAASVFRSPFLLQKVDFDCVYLSLPFVK